MERRNFIRSTLAAGGLLAFSAAQTGDARSVQAQRSRTAAPRAVLGRTGVMVSRLGVGCAHLGREGATEADMSSVLHRALELGVTYFDTAPNYGKAEERMGPTIREIRDKIFLVTKCEEASYGQAWRSIRRSLKLLQTDHIDLIHIHNFGHEERFPDAEYTLSDKGALGALQEAKKQGVISFIGATGHLHPSRFHAALNTGEIDVIMNAVNFIAQHTYDFEHKVWARAKTENIGLVAMKVLGGMQGKTLQQRIPKEYYFQAIRYALSIPGITTAVIGVNNVAELEQNAEIVRTMNPLTPEEANELSRIGLELAQQKEWATSYGEPLA